MNIRRPLFNFGVINNLWELPVKEERRNDQNASAVVCPLQSFFFFCSRRGKTENDFAAVLASKSNKVMKVREQDAGSLPLSSKLPLHSKLKCYSDACGRQRNGPESELSARVALPGKSGVIIS